MGWFSSSEKAAEVWICESVGSEKWKSLLKSKHDFAIEKAQRFSVQQCWDNHNRADAEYRALNAGWKPEIDVDCWVLQRLARAWHLVVSPYLVVWCGSDGDKVIAYDTDGNVHSTLLGNKEWAKL